jgi:formiminotetrahydrofolate cyclodeaminase
MVIGLTIGKKVFLGYASEIQQKLLEIQEECDMLKREFLDLCEKDNRSFEKVMEAMKLPKENEDQKKYRKEKIQESYLGAMKVPLEVARKVLGFYEKIGFVAEYGNKNCISDVGVAALQALSSVEGAILNVKINLSGIENENLSKEILIECTEIVERAREIHKTIMVLVEGPL